MYRSNADKKEHLPPGDITNQHPITFIILINQSVFPSSI